MALTGKKKLFADAILAGKTNKDAAIAAGYSAKTAAQAGARLVKDKDVAAHLAKCRAAAEKGEPPPDDRPKFDINAALLHADPKSFLLAAMNDGELEPKQRIEAAKALMPFMHQKLGESGKKEQAKTAAKAAAGKFASAPPPKLVANNGKRI